MSNRRREPMWRRYVRFLRSDITADVDEELEFHLEMLRRAYEARGLSPEAARRAAGERFGDVGRVAGWLRRHDAHQQRARRAREIMSTMGQDLHVGVRALVRQPTFTAATVLTLALGIGATTAMFSVVYGVLLRPLPFTEPDRLVRVWTAWKPSFGRGAVSAANGRDWRAQSHVFEDLALIQNSGSFNFTGREGPERLQGASVWASFFPVLGVAPLLGRTFTDQENEFGHENVVVLSHALWLRRFGGDPAIIGRTIPLNGAATTVVGVMKPDFRFPSGDTELWVPLTVPADEYLHRMWGSYRAVARLKARVTLEQARADLRVVSANLARQYHDNARIEAGIAPLLDDMVEGVRRPLVILFGAVGAMLLIGCANLANLLMARGVVRRRELAVRTALGASRARLVEQSMTELVPLLTLGAALGLLVAFWLVRVVVPILPADLPRSEGIEINLPVVAFTTATVTVVALLVGVWPAAADAAQTSLRSGLAELSRSSTAGAPRAHLRDLLVVGQIAATLLLLVGAMVLARSFAAVASVSPGFQPDHVLSVQIAIPRTKYPLDRDVAGFYDRVLDRVQALPGVAAAGIVNRLPLGGGNQTGSFAIDRGGRDGRSPNVQTRTVSPDYFRALGIPILTGRPFTRADGVDAPGVAIVDENLARRIWPGTSPIGRRIREVEDTPWSTIVGVVGHIRHTGLEADQEPQVYWNYTQRAQETMALVVKARAEPATLTQAIAAAVREVDAAQPIYAARTLDDVIDSSLGQRRFETTVLAVFAAVAVLLASIGTYGVIAYGVGQRRREFGVRMALGARRRDVVTMVLRRGVTLFGVGAALGIALAVATLRVLATLVYGVSPRDPVSFMAATAVLFAVSVAACCVPARRAGRVDPSIALRSD